MRLKLSDLWRWDGNISRGPFVLWAGVLFLIKYNLDRLILRWAFGREWSIFSYFEQPLPAIGNLSPAQSPKEFITLLGISLPFLWAGTMLCLKRLRSARLPLWLAVLFVMPIVKWFLFIALGIAPDRGEDRQKIGRQASWLPQSVWGSAALAIGSGVLLGLGAAFLGAKVLRGYGWGLFVGAPFSMGFFSALIHGAGVRRGLGESVAVGLASVGLAGAMLLALAFEGAICLVMAAPLAFALGAMGALAGHAVQSSCRRDLPPELFCIPILAMPLMLGTESLRPGPPPSLKVVTAIEVDASVETVWSHVVQFTELPPPHEFLFKAGIAYPLRAEIRGHGAGAVRHCVFSTGPFVEPIEVWNEPQLLKFSVTSNPAPLEEWTPYHAIHPPHLKGFLVSEQGQFQLTALAGRRTLLEGTTWYHHTMWPARYWQIWSDQIIHTIHKRVLEHVKRLAERDPALIHGR
jgi:uncharacterized membrane protein YhaH (DUF805 family)